MTAGSRTRRGVTRAWTAREGSGKQFTGEAHLQLRGMAGSQDRLAAAAVTEVR
jgi:hypothetical protein